MKKKTTTSTKHTTQVKMYIVYKNNLTRFSKKIQTKAKQAATNTNPLLPQPANEIHETD